MSDTNNHAASALALAFERTQHQINFYRAQASALQESSNDPFVMAVTRRVMEDAANSTSERRNARFDIIPHYNSKTKRATTEIRFQIGTFNYILPYPDLCHVAQSVGADGSDLLGRLGIFEICKAVLDTSPSSEIALTPEDPTAKFELTGPFIRTRRTTMSFNVGMHKITTIIGYNIADHDVVGVVRSGPEDVGITKPAPFNIITVSKNARARPSLRAFKDYIEDVRGLAAPSARPRPENGASRDPT